MTVEEMVAHIEKESLAVRAIIQTNLEMGRIHPSVAVELLRRIGRLHELMAEEHADIARRAMEIDRRLNELVVGGHDESQGTKG